VQEQKRHTGTNPELHQAMLLVTLSDSEKSKLLMKLQEQAGYHVPWILVAIGLGGLWYVLCGYVL
jgi:hypothetical protein